MSLLKCRRYLHQSTTSHGPQDGRRTTDTSCWSGCVHLSSCGELLLLKRKKCVGKHHSCAD